MITAEDHEAIGALLEEVGKEGFGEIRIVVMNGCVHRVLKSDDCLHDRFLERYRNKKQIEKSVLTK